MTQDNIVDVWLRTLLEDRLSAGNADCDLNLVDRLSADPSEAQREPHFEHVRQCLYCYLYWDTRREPADEAESRKVLERVRTALSSGWARGVLRALIDKGAALLSGRGEEGEEFELAPAMAGVGSTLQSKLNRASLLLAEGSAHKAKDELRAAAEENARAAQQSSGALLRDKQEAVRVTVNSRRRTVVVEVFPRTGEAAPARAVLISDDAADLSADFEQLEGERRWLAEFKKVPDGEYRVRLR